MTRPQDFEDRLTATRMAYTLGRAGWTPVIAPELVASQRLGLLHRVWFTEQKPWVKNRNQFSRREAP